MRLFRRGPKYQDEALRGLSVMFVADTVDPTPGVELLDAARFDFTLASLHALDEYLEVMRERTLEDRDGRVMVLRAGAYLGEVVRRVATERTWHWVDYDEAARLAPDQMRLAGRNLGTAAVLIESAQSMTFPLGKILKFLDNGPEDSTHFYGLVFSGAVKIPRRDPNGPKVQVVRDPQAGDDAL